MDQKIKKTKASIDKNMDSLLKADKKNDKKLAKCDMAMKSNKKNK